MIPLILNQQFYITTTKITITVMTLLKICFKMKKKRENIDTPILY